MKRRAASLIAVAFALAFAACAHPQARTQPVHVPLDVPLPPARTIAPPPEEEAPAVAAQPPDAPTAKPPARPRSTPPKPEPAQSPAAPPAAPPQTPQPASGALQTTTPANQAEMISTIRGMLARANRDLKSIADSSYGSLSADGKAQFATATRFAEQAEQALKDLNLVFALTLADKAATLARSLAGRY